MTSDFLSSACAALSSAKHKLADAEPHVADAPGLYAIYGSVATWQQLGLGDPPDARPLYVGKAEASMKARDLNQHFKTGSTGQSTVRRTFAALLRDAYAFRGVPRSKSNPEKASHFALDDEHDASLTCWMNERLQLATWIKPVTCSDLHAVELGVLRRWVPSLNIQDNGSSPWLAKVRSARRMMADDARTWAKARGVEI